jgi:hypothetical protein
LSVDGLESPKHQKARALHEQARDLPALGGRRLAAHSRRQHRRPLLPPTHRSCDTGRQRGNHCTLSPRARILTHPQRPTPRRQHHRARRFPTPDFNSNLKRGKLILLNVRLPPSLLHKPVAKLLLSFTPRGCAPFDARDTARVSGRSRFTG